MPKAGERLPANKYLRLIIGGARHWKLPSDYIDVLETINTSDNAKL